jgi:GT2 family glycosyltransferase
VFLTIVIVSYKARADLERCLASLTDAPPAIPHEIVIVDNASDDGSADAARRLRPDARVIALGENVGFARANNVGIRATRGDLLLLLNSDTVVSKGAIDRLVAALEETPKAAVAGPRLIGPDSETELSFGAMVGPLAEWRQKSFGRALEARDQSARARLASLTTRRHMPDWVSGACLLVWRADAEAVGLLDERYFMYLEDVDFCAALRARGRAILFVPEVSVTHLRGRSRRSAPSATQRAYRQSQVAFYDKHHPVWAPFLRGYLWVRGQLHRS